MKANLIEKKGLIQDFEQASQCKEPDKSKPRKKTPPFSLRLTLEERALLDQKAGNQPLGAYIRKRLLGEQTQKRRSIRKPKADEKQIAMVLAELGRSRLSSNLNQLAKAAHTGTLGVPETVERELLVACRAIAIMRDALISALGLKPEGE